LARIQPIDAGTYTVLVSNVVGSTTSNPALLRLNVPVSLPTQPAALAVNPGATATFSVVAAGTAPFTYQWRKGGVPIDGGTQDVYTIPSAQFADDGTFDVVVRNVAGVATSASAVLMVNVPVSVATQPVGATVNPGITTTFKVTVEPGLNPARVAKLPGPPAAAGFQLPGYVVVEARNGDGTKDWFKAFSETP
jgi:hypothetical protein